MCRFPFSSLLLPVGRRHAASSPLGWKHQGSVWKGLGSVKACDEQSMAACGLAASLTRSKQTAAATSAASPGMSRGPQKDSQT